jgi:hypothetical protein
MSEGIAAIIPAVPRHGHNWPLQVLRPQRQAHRLASPLGGVQSHLGHGEWVKILRGSGFVIDALHELLPRRMLPIIPIT